jgi:hypothetical protein
MSAVAIDWTKEKVVVTGGVYCGRFCGGYRRELLRARILRAGLRPAGARLHKYVKQDDRYFGPSAVDPLLSGSSEARKVLSWKPRTSFKELVRLMVENDLELAQGTADADEAQVSVMGISLAAIRSALALCGALAGCSGLRAFSLRKNLAGRGTKGGRSMIALPVVLPLGLWSWLIVAVSTPLRSASLERISLGRTT